MSRVKIYGPQVIKLRAGTEGLRRVLSNLRCHDSVHMKKFSCNNCINQYYLLLVLKLNYVKIM